MNDFIPRFRGKPIPYTMFIGVFFLALFMLQIVFLYYFYVFTPEAFNLYFFSLSVFFLIGLLMGVVLLLYPYIKRTFDIHLVVLVSLSVAIILNFVFLYLDVAFSEFSVFGIHFLGLWHVISLGMIFVIWAYVLEVELEWNPEKEIKTVEKTNLEGENIKNA